MSKYGKRPFKSNIQRKAWQPVLVNGGTTQTYPGGGESVYIFALASNTSAGSNPSPTIVKFKNVKLQLTLETATSVMSTGIVYVAFIPEGYTTSIDTVTQHPEWLMGWKRVQLRRSDDNTARFKASCSFTSHLARNLKSGDRIVFCVQMLNPSGSDIDMTETHTASYVVCNN